MGSNPSLPWVADDGIRGERRRGERVCPRVATLTFKQHFRELQHGRPGKRFQLRYEKARKARHGRSAPGRIVRLVLGFAAIGVGLVLLVIPGPGIPFIFIGGGLLATESLVVAKAMDWLEVKGRAVAHWLESHWEKLPLWGKIVTVALLVSVAAAAAYVAYQWFMG